MWILNKRGLYLEAKTILKNPGQWSSKKVEKAKEIVKNYVIQEPTPITDEQRAEIKRKYPKTYE